MKDLHELDTLIMHQEAKLTYAKALIRDIVSIRREAEYKESYRLEVEFDLVSERKEACKECQRMMNDTMKHAEKISAVSQNAA